MKKLLLFFLFHLMLLHTNAQTAKVYRGGVLIGSYTTVAAACAAANTIGDSILLSAHTFKEHNIPMEGGQIWQGTITATDTSTIDAENKGRIQLTSSLGYKGRACVIRDIICTNGSTTGSGANNNGGGFLGIKDSLVLRGNTIVRNCYALGGGGAIYGSALLYDKVKLINNVSDSFGGASRVGLFVYDSVEIAYNRSMYGGAVGDIWGSEFHCNSPGVRVHHNTASVAGGAVYGFTFMTAGQITDNQAPLGAAMYTIPCGSGQLQNVRVYNPRPDGKRQNEIYLRSGSLDMQGSWFGQSDTTGLIIIGTGFPVCTWLTGKPAKANWSVNWAKALSKKDTLFPIGARFTYIDGTALPPKSCPWLVGNFTSNAGVFLNPKPLMQANDTLSSLFRTYIYAIKGDTSSKPISYVCSIDADTFRISPLVWGRDTNKVNAIPSYATMPVLVYPNPTKDILMIQGLEMGCGIALYDVAGVLVKTISVTTPNVSVDLRDVAVGIYLLRVTTADGHIGTAQVRKE